MQNITHQNVGAALDMTLNFIWLGDSYSGVLENKEYPLIDFTPRPTLASSK